MQQVEEAGRLIAVMRKIYACIILIMITLCSFAQAQIALQYVETLFGYLPYLLEEHELSASLKEGMSDPREQQATRYPGVPTHETLLRRIEVYLDGSGKENSCRGWRFFPARPQRFMPYLDSLFVPGNTCIEPCEVVREDGISTAAQGLKTRLSRYGLQYAATLSMNYAGLPQNMVNGRRDFLSTNNVVNATWFLAKDCDNSQGFFLSVELDWGQGVGYSERSRSVQDSIGSLSNPQGSARGGHGLFIPNLALGYSCFNGKWVGMIGTIDTTDFLDQNGYSESWSGNLTNRAFNFNPCLPLEWANWGYMTAWQPTKNFYTMYATTGCNGQINHNPFPYISSNAWVHIGEIGYISENFLGLGPGIYRFQYTATRYEGENGSGAAFNIQQQLGHDSRLGFFTRCGVLDEDAATVSDVRACATAGLVLQAPFRSHGWGSKSNNEQIALGVLWERAAESAKPYAHKDEYGVELSAVVQLTPTFYIQPDVQYIFNPVHETSRSGAFVLQVQGVFKF